MPEELEIGLHALGKIRIIYTGDLHGNVEKMQYISTVVKGLRGQNPDSLLLDSGDWSKGSPINDRFAGKPMADIVNYLRYDALALGEADLSWGIRGLKKLAEAAGVPFLCCNLGGGALPAFIKPYIIKDLVNIRVAVTGLSPTVRLTERHYTMQEPEAALKAVLEEIKKEDPAVTIVLSHLGIEQDRKLAALFPGLALIIGGHSHIRTEAPEKAGTVLIVHSGSHGDYVGSLELDIGNVLTIRSRE